MERALSADLERVASSMSNDEASELNVQLLSNDSILGDAHIRVPAEGQIARDAIEAAYATTLTTDQMKRLVVSMAGEEIDMETDFVSNGIEDGARLEVRIIMSFFPVHVALLQQPLRRVCCWCSALHRSLS